jgi:hypothetical protein
MIALIFFEVPTARPRKERRSALDSLRHQRAQRAAGESGLCNALRDVEPLREIRGGSRFPSAVRRWPAATSWAAITNLQLDPPHQVASS